MLGNEHDSNHVMIQVNCYGYTYWLVVDTMELIVMVLLLELKNCPLTEFSFPSKFNHLREFIISLYLFEVNQRQQQCGLLVSKPRKIRMVQWRLPNIPYCSCHCWISHRAGWKMCVGISVGQTTSQSKNMLTYIEFGPCSERCLTPWNTAFREVGKLLCQRQGEGSPFPSAEGGRHRYQQWDKGLLSLWLASTAALHSHASEGHMDTFWSRIKRKQQQFCQGKWSGENIRQKTIILIWAPLPVWASNCVYDSGHFHHRPRPQPTPLTQTRCAQDGDVRFPYKTPFTHLFFFISWLTVFNLFQTRNWLFFWLFSAPFWSTECN